jgi:hypothetical protein
VDHIERIKGRGRRLGKAEGSPNAWYYRLPWVLVAAAAMVLLVYVISLCGVITFLYHQLVEAPLERLLARRR